ncbi:MAG TPA: NHL repeat-containing protein [Ktedonobacteraceae bacterium]|nr:NHL repeat-containing protein [Ktedonobacteraceae bacterium]
MFAKRVSAISTALLFCFVMFASCTSSISSSPTPTPNRITPTVPITSPTSESTLTSAPDTTPTRYTSNVLLSGVGRPDDLAFDQQGHLLFSDFYNGTVSRLNADGSVTKLVTGLAGPEGLVVLSNGTMIIAEQRTNRILTLAPGAKSLTVLRAIPGTPSSASCKDGIDGIALDGTTNTLIVPDSPTGDVYRLSLDGKKLTLITSGIVRPVGAVVDAQGTIFVADECGGAIVRITPDGRSTRIAGFGMPDDVAFDHYGNLLLIDLLPSIHALIRIRQSTGKREILANKGFIEPQGLVVDENDNIYVSDDYANKIVEFKPQ